MYRVFIYDLPQELSSCGTTKASRVLQYTRYGAELLLPRLLKESSAHATDDPELADFFWVPAVFNCPGEGRRF